MCARKNDFSDKIKNKLFRNCGGICSNPNCRCFTSFSSDSEVGSTTLVGEACHIISCSKDGGKRRYPEVSDEERQSYYNGIWLCVKCHKIIDSDEITYTVELLHKWKDDAEKEHKKRVLNNIKVSTKTEKLNKYDLSAKNTLDEILKYINEIKDILKTVNNYYQAYIKIDDKEKLTQLVKKDHSCLNRVIMSLTNYNRIIMDIKKLSFSNKKNFSKKVNKDLDNLIKTNSRCFRLEGAIPLSILTDLLFSITRHYKIINEVLNQTENDIKEFIN